MTRLLAWLAVVGVPVAAFLNPDVLLPARPWGLVVWLGAVVAGLVLGVLAVYRLRGEVEDREIALRQRIDALEGGRLVLSPELVTVRMSSPAASYRTDLPREFGYCRTLTVRVVAPIDGPFDLEVVSNVSPTRAESFASSSGNQHFPVEAKTINRRSSFHFKTSLRPPERRREVITKQPLTVVERDTFLSVTLYADETPEFVAVTVMPPAGPPPTKSGS